MQQPLSASCPRGNTRRYFSSAADQVMVIRISADKPGSISFSALLRRGRYFDAVKASGNNTISMFASCGSEKGIRFCTSVRVLRRPRFGVQFAQALIETGVEITTVLDKEDCMLPYDVI